MKTPHPNPYSTLTISREVYLQLLSAAGHTGFEKEDWEIAAAAINDWVRRHSPDAIAMPATAGYQWKEVFLPNGTLLRTIFKGKNHHCLVEEDRILYEGRAMSPSGFVNAVGGIRRNAWKSVWILLPETTTWKLADSLRTKKRRGHARKISPSGAAPSPRSPAPLRSSDTGNATQERHASQPAHRVPPPAPSTSPQSDNTQDIEMRTNRSADVRPLRGAYRRDTRSSPRLDHYAGRSNEHRHGDDDAIEGLMRKALLALTRSLLAP